jgi:hypothetical protein
MINLRYTRRLISLMAAALTLPSLGRRLCCESVRSDAGRTPMTVFMLSQQ